MSSDLLYCTAPSSTKRRARPAERARHVVLELDLGTRARHAARQDGVGEQREPRVAPSDLLLQLVDPLLEIAEAHRVRCAVHGAAGTRSRGARGSWHRRCGGRARGGRSRRSRRRGGSARGSCWCCRSARGCSGTLLSSSSGFVPGLCKRRCDRKHGDQQRNPKRRLCRTHYLTPFFAWSIGSESLRPKVLRVPVKRAVYSAGWPKCNGYILGRSPHSGRSIARVYTDLEPLGTDLTSAGQAPIGAQPLDAARNPPIPCGRIHGDAGRTLSDRIRRIQRKGTPPVPGLPLAALEGPSGWVEKRTQKVILYEDYPYDTGG